MNNGYIQADLLGRVRGIKFGMLALQQISMEAQRLGSVLGSSVDLAMVPVIIYWGLFNNCYIKREDPDFTFEDVVQFVDDHVSEPERFTPIVECLYQSKLIAGEPQAEDAKGKKKVRPDA